MSGSTVRVCIAPGDVAWNRGDEAILAGVLRGLEEDEREFEVVCVFTSDPERVTRRHGVPAILDGPTHIPVITRMIRQSDVMIFGGGHLLQDESSQLFIPFQLFKVVAAIALRRKVFCFAVGAGPIRTAFSRATVRWICSRLAAISTRDDESRAWLKRTGIVRPPIMVTADPAVLVAPAPETKGREILEREGVDLRETPVVGIAPRLWFHYGHHLVPVALRRRWGLLSRKQLARFEELEQFFADTADTLIERLGAQVVFVPMSLGPGQEDHQLAQRVRKRMRFPKSAVCLSGDYPPAELKAVIGRLSLMIGVRLHSTIMSTSALVPSIHLAYGHKGHEYFRAIRMTNFALDLEDATVSSVVDLSLKALAEQAEIRTALSEAIPEVERRAQLNFKMLGDLVA